MLCVWYNYSHKILKITLRFRMVVYSSKIFSLFTELLSKIQSYRLALMAYSWMVVESKPLME